MANTKITSANLDTLTTLTVDDITIDGSTISDSGDLTLDVGGDIVLDAAGGDVSLKNAGNEAGKIVIGDATDGTIKITSLSSITLDAAGDIILDADGDDWKFHEGGTAVFEIKHESHGVDFLLNTGDEDWRFKGSDGGQTITALQLDISDAGQAIFNSGASFEGGKLTINEFTSPSSFTQIRKTNTGSNLAIVSQESIYMLLDENNDQTNRAFFIEHGAGSPGTGTTLFKVQEDGKTGIGINSPASALHISGGDNTAAKLTITNTANTNTYSIHAQNNAQTLHFQEDGSNVMSLETGGNLTTTGFLKAKGQLITQGTRAAGRGELYLNGTGEDDVAEIFFGYGDGFTVGDGNIRWGISDRGHSNGHLIIYEGPKNAGAFTEVASFTKTDGAFKVVNGIRFGTDTASANTLDDYEEGTWTPVLEGSSGNPTVAYQFRSAYYIKIGNLLFIRFGFRLTSRSGGSGVAQVGGLPYTAKNYGSYQQPAIFTNSQGLTVDPDGPILMYFMDNNNKIQGRLMNNADTVLPISYFQAGSWCIGSGVYDVS